MKRSAGCILKAAVLILGFGISTTASAIPVFWTLDNVTFDDGATASGSFVFDADIGVYSSINMTSSPGSVVTDPHTYSFVGSSFTDASQLLALESAPAGGTDQTDISYLYFNFVGDLTNTGGTISVLGAGGGFTSLGICNNPSCGSARDFNKQSTGNVIAFQVPEPSTALLLAAGLTVIVIRRRRLR